ncbi:MAG: PIG-L family deacetylase [Bacteroidales bacterium]|nr:PIG-L family deacetylase [Bacteroidales bacterium]
MTGSGIKKVAIIVAHPDDETLWAGGTILNHPSWNCFIACLCRGMDMERSEKFHKALKIYGAEGSMGDLDDGPEQNPLENSEVEKAVLALLPNDHYDLLITHNPAGEYTRHLRHEEAGKAVIRLWGNGSLSAGRLWTFAYEDGNRQYYPRPVREASIYRLLTRVTWFRKYRIVTETYGFEENSFEAETTPRAESFWQYKSPVDAKTSLFNQLIS